MKPAKVLTGNAIKPIWEGETIALKWNGNGRHTDVYIRVPHATEQWEKLKKEPQRPPAYTLEKQTAKHYPRQETDVLHEPHRKPGTIRRSVTPKQQKKNVPLVKRLWKKPPTASMARWHKHPKQNKIRQCINIAPQTPHAGIMHDHHPVTINSTTYIHTYAHCLIALIPCPPHTMVLQNKVRDNIVANCGEWNIMMKPIQHIQHFHPRSQTNQ